jgi:hypothetical protein
MPSNSNLPEWSVWYRLADNQCRINLAGRNSDAVDQMPHEFSIRRAQFFKAQCLDGASDWFPMKDATGRVELHLVNFSIAKCIPGPRFPAPKSPYMDTTFVGSYTKTDAIHGHYDCR